MGSNAMWEHLVGFREQVCAFFGMFSLRKDLYIVHIRNDKDLKN